ncbi:Os05g0115200 [Oryza sativa Japonica Group]|uniref:Os05g0115200 protein n=1 Tax=Oryza sativa subsp. japonica TaxID=39947 RepID=Q65XA6_ORYSJ|nr:unknown protein [Oryza sativa Japonica Group]AAV44193.1 unknow protein [Oryza sativa Japonica Group]BAH92910.1 Os05g0115200 [Oryza sativa Japonica Group]|eukprot:NP_001174182.1 Os05g0115200 [Oryza sativa Japonica Group]
MEGKMQGHAWRRPAHASSSPSMGTARNGVGMIELQDVPAH